MGLLVRPTQFAHGSQAKVTYVSCDGSVVRTFLWEKGLMVDLPVFRSETIEVPATNRRSFSREHPCLACVCTKK